MVLTCFSIVKWRCIITPRFLTHGTTLTILSPTVRVMSSLAPLYLEEKAISSGFSWFNFSMLLSIHGPMSATHVSQTAFTECHFWLHFDYKIVHHLHNYSREDRAFWQCHPQVLCTYSTSLAPGRTPVERHIATLYKLSWNFLAVWTLSVRYDFTQSHRVWCYAKWLYKAANQYLMVNGVKCCRLIEHD